MFRLSPYLREDISSPRVGRAVAAKLCATLLFLTFFSCRAVAQESEFAYVASSEGNQVAAYRVNTSTGALTPLGGPAVTAGHSGSSAIAIEQHRGYVYIAKGNSVDNNVAGFQIDRSSGRLSPVPGSPFHAGTSPAALAVDPSGDRLYVANSDSNNISAFKIDPGSGRLHPLAGSPFATGNAPDALAIDPAGKFLFVADKADGNISAFTVNPSTGALTPVPGSPFATGASPAALAVDPVGIYLYVGAGDGKVYGYGINASTGALNGLLGTPVATGDGAVNGVTVDPTDSRVYAAAAGGIYTYSIGKINTCFPCVSAGSLSFVSVTPPGTGTTPDASEWTPTSFVQDYTGTFGYAPDGAGATSITGLNTESTAIPGSPFSDPRGAGPMAIARPLTYPIFSAEMVPLTAFQPVRTVTVGGINNLGHAIGTVTLAESEVLDLTFLFADGATQNGGGFGSHTAFAYGINDKDQVVGTSATSVPEGQFTILSEAYLFSGGTTINIDGRTGGQSAAYAINNNGLVTGSWSTGTCSSNYCQTFPAPLGDTHAFLYNGAMNDLGTLGGNFSEGRGINNRGVIVGGSNTAANGPIHLFRYERSRMFDLGMMMGQPTEGAAINDSGEIVGSIPQGFVYTNGRFHALPTLRGGTYIAPAGIDKFGFIAGTCGTPVGPTRACAYGFGETFDLNRFVDPGQNLLVSAQGINNHGQIVAQGLDGQVYVLTPTRAGLNDLQHHDY